MPSGEAGAADPADATRVAWLKDGARLETEARVMRRPDDAHAPWVAAAEGASASLRKAAIAVRDTLAEDRRTVFDRLPGR